MKNKYQQKLEQGYFESNSMYEHLVQETKAMEDIAIINQIKIYNPGEKIDSKRKHKNFTILMQVIMYSNTTRKNSIISNYEFGIPDSVENIELLNQFFISLTKHLKIYNLIIENGIMIETSGGRLILPQDYYPFLDMIYFYNQKSEIYNFDLGRLLATEQYEVPDYVLNYPDCKNQLELIAYLDSKILELEEENIYNELKKNHTR